LNRIKYTERIKLNRSEINSISERFKKWSLMPHKTYTESVSEHIAFLQSQGLDVDSLQVDAGFIRCKKIGNTEGRGELCYKTTSTLMKNDLLGLATWCRGIHGDAKFKNYGLNRGENDQVTVIENPQIQLDSAPNERHELAAKKAYGFWNNSSHQGFSDYLDKKGVGSHGLRFRESVEFGRVAVAPMLDASGHLWSYQLLNPDGTKRHPKDSRTEGLFHCLTPLLNGSTFGIAESYVTAATCYELTGIPTVCAFSCHNLVSVAKSLRQKYRDSRIVFFADNDRHIESNQGVLMAQEAFDAIDGFKSLAIPDFEDCEPNKSASDWNDLVQLKGKAFALGQLSSLGLIKENCAI
jgi:phage/plasmid primase-like uncharacterized protein